MPACALALLLALVGCRGNALTADGGSAARSDRAPAAERATTTDDEAIVPLSTPPADWTALAGRRVRIDATLTVSGLNASVPDPPGLPIASFGGRLSAPTEVALPGPPAQAIAIDNDRRGLQIDAPAGVDTSAWRAGTALSGLQGTIADGDAGLSLRLDAPPTVVIAPRPPAPTVAGDLRLASFNLENFFNGDGRGGGFPTPRGARTPAEFAAQRDKLVATIRALDPDIAALMEVENDGDGPQSSLAALVDALNAGGGAKADWRVVAGGARVGSDQIRVGLIHRAARATPVGGSATLTGGPFDARSRVPLAQAFRAGRGPVFVVAAVHFKSKGCGQADGADRDQHDGQACWNAARLDSARRVDAWLKRDPTHSGSDLAVIVGDLNTYALEDPVRLLRDSGWRDALAVAGVDAPYSYVYGAQAGRLDHALLSPPLAARLAGAAEWHSNADEPDNVGYRAANGGQQPATPWRSSDHDPLLIGLRLRTP